MLQWGVAVRKVRRVRNTREDCPFQPWSGGTASHWEVNPKRTKQISSGAVLGRLTLVMVPILFVGLAGLALARHAGNETSPGDKLRQSACADRHIAELVREHLRAVRGL